jgi:hypothetical protein
LIAELLDRTPGQMLDRTDGQMEQSGVEDENRLNIRLSP